MVLDFNQKMTRVVEEVVRTLPEFAMVKMSRLRVSVSYSQPGSRSGLVAYLLPLKYKDGRPFERRVRGNREYHYAMVPLYEDGIELLYLIYFLLPRFLNLSMREKLETIVHELYHISPHFNGDVRRLKGRSYLHGNSLDEFDLKISKLTDKFLKLPHDANTYQFLRGNRRQIESREGKILTHHVVEPKPTLLKVAKAQPPRPTEAQLSFF